MKIEQKIKRVMEEMESLHTDVHRHIIDLAAKALNKKGHDFREFRMGAHVPTKWEFIDSDGWSYHPNYETYPQWDELRDFLETYWDELELGNIVLKITK